MGKKIKHIGNFDHIPLLEEVKRNHEWWYWDTSRQKHISFHKETLSIALMGWEKEEGVHQRDQMNTFEWEHFQDAFSITFNFLKEIEFILNSDLKMAAYVLLPVGKEVYPHIDGGEFYKACDRYHFMLQGICQMNVEDENEIFSPGNLYWFDNTLMHDVQNVGSQDRIVLIFDMLKDQ